MKTLKLKPTSSNLSIPKPKETEAEARAKEFAVVFLIAGVFMFMPESFAQGTQAATTDAFNGIYNKLTGWANGTAGKLITLITLLFGAVGGVLGFNPRLVFGCIGVGLMLSFSKAIVEILF